MKEQLWQLNGCDVEQKLHRLFAPESFSLKIQQELEGSIYGQKEALGQVAERLAVIESGMCERNRPLGAIFMLGPTGVGKTETAHAISKRWFGSERSPNFLTLNGAEFTEPHSIMRIVGSPPSYVGWSEQSALPHNVINGRDAEGNHKRSLVLIDEAEKMHPIVHQSFLSALDKGFLMARNGKEGEQPLNFTNTLFLFTSNIAGDKIHDITSQRSLGFSMNQSGEDRNTKIDVTVRSEMRRYFSPEFRNRLTDIVVFQELSKSSGIYEKIFWKFMQQTNDDMKMKLRDKAPYLLASKELMQSIIESIDTSYGARDLKRAIEKQVLSVFASFVTSYDLGNKVVAAHRDENGEIGFYTDYEEKPPMGETIFEPEPREDKKKPFPEHSGENQTEGGSITCLNSNSSGNSGNKNR